MMTSDNRQRVGQGAWATSIIPSLPKFRLRHWVEHGFVPCLSALTSRASLVVYCAPD